MPHRGDQLRLAEKLEVDQGNLSRVASGRKVPGLKMRLLLMQRCSIPVDWWDQPDAGSESEVA